MLSNKYLTKRNINYLILLISIMTVAGSLFVSQILLLEPCTWCWWVRVFMFPLFFISLYITFTKKYEIMNLYSIFCAFSTVITFVYWYKTQFAQRSFNCKISFHSAGGCLDNAVPIIGFVNLPFLGFVASIMILILVYIANRVK